ncbi:MAG: DUF433 domain-containing protein [Dehalococcoidia bacterium]
MVAGKALSEAEKLRRVPGVVYVDGAVGRRARVIGALDVFEIIKQYREVGYSRERLTAEFDWLTAQQLDTAVAFYEAFPEEIDERLALEDEVTPAWLREHFSGVRR